MIPRYQLPNMALIWSENFRFQTMFAIEVYAAEAMVEKGLIPRECVAALHSVSSKDISIDRILELEQITRHETIAFLTHLEELAGPKSAGYLHYGMTSSDLLDSCLSIQLMHAGDLILHKITTLCEALKKQALAHKNTICIGRSHGVHAEPTTFGLKMAQAYAEMRRNHYRMLAAKKEISVGAISGPVGTYAGIDLKIEEYVCQHLTLRPETISTQIIPRDRHATYFSTLSIIASSLERLAIEIRSLQRTEIREVEEAFASTQKGSSAMPHKRNPILAENITGLARLIRTQVIAALENISLWHERDMSHSSVERIIAPDMTSALHFALDRMANIIDCLKVNRERMHQNMALSNESYFSHVVLSALIKAGATRQDAYSILQRNTATVHNKNIKLSDVLQSDPEVTALIPKEKLLALFDDNHFLQHVDAIFDKVFAEGQTESVI